jgi:hypothetical protein
MMIRSEAIPSIVSVAIVIANPAHYIPEAIWALLGGLIQFLWRRIRPSLRFAIRRR